MMLRRIDGACDSLLFVSSPRCENTTARQTAAHPLRGYTPLRRQHGEELEPSHRAFLRGSGSRINYSRSGPCTAAKATTQCPLWVIFVRLARSRRSRHVRFAPKADKRRLASLCPLCAFSAAGLSSPHGTGRIPWHHRHNPNAATYQWNARRTDLLFNIIV